MKINDDELKIVLKDINAKKTFSTFITEISKHHAVLKKHYVLLYHDEERGDYFQFDFYDDLDGQIKIKFELLSFILQIDEDEIEGILKKLKWFFKYESGFTLDQIIYEASFGPELSPKLHDLTNFTHFEKREWDNFVRYIL